MDHKAQERERLARYRVEQEAREAEAARLAELMEGNHQAVVDGEVINPTGRPVGGDNTASKNNRLGLSGAIAVDRKPLEMLFRVGPGWFDLDGYWCVENHKGEVVVTRGASKDQMRRLSDAQRKMTKHRLAARRQGLR